MKSCRRKRQVPLAIAQGYERRTCRDKGTKTKKVTTLGLENDVELIFVLLGVSLIGFVRERGTPAIHSE